MAEPDLVQLNVAVDPSVEEIVDALGSEYEWSRRHTVALAIRALANLMGAHQSFAVQLEDDIGEFYKRLAAEMPAGFVEVPKDGVRVGRAGDLPAVLVDNWLVFPDRETGALLAENQADGGPPIGRVLDGQIKPLKLPSPGEVALN